ncbi:MAG: DUF4199 domain-containing protein, partial [Rikenellaceae bacterium]
MTNKNSTFWQDSSTTGIYIGVALSLSVVVAYLMRDTSMLAAVNNFIVIGSMFGITYYRGKLYSKKDEYKPFGYPAALRYVIISLGFAGIIYGGALYVMYNHVAPEYYHQEVMKMMEVMSQGSQNTETISQAYSSFIVNPLYIVMTSVLSMFFMGLFPALIVSALIKRNYV